MRTHEAEAARRVAWRQAKVLREEAAAASVKTAASVSDGADDPSGLAFPGVFTFQNRSTQNEYY